MAQALVRNLEDQVKVKRERRAWCRGRSMEEETAKFCAMPLWFGGWRRNCRIPPELAEVRPAWFRRGPDGPSDNDPWR